MDTVNNIINSASKMVYGENANQNTTGTTTDNTTGSTTQQSSSLLGDGSSTTTTGNTTGGREPLSGQTGAGTPNQPYDAGNTTGEPTNTIGGSSTTGTTSGTTSGFNESTHRDSNPATSGTTASNDNISKGPSANAPTEVGSAPPDSGAVGQKQQGADRPREEPDSTETQAIKDKQAAADDVQSGSTGSSSTGGASGGVSGSGSNDAGPKPLGGGDGPGSNDDDVGLGSVSKEPGTGEKYIKSTGTAADGGDFDAANAGAGREADRLLAEKGIHRDDPNKPSDAPAGNQPGHHALGDKKGKLHVGPL